ncbi:MAG: pirin family protein [Myxococcota bacterium]
MIEVRRAEERGRFDFGWLETHHTFSFGEYHDPDHMGFRALRVLNEDRIAPGRGFGTHPHRDMEILTYVLEGALRHADSMENGSVIVPGDVQRMSAGTGVLHSEINPSESEVCHLLQIWILPERSGLEPGYEQKRFAPEDLRDRLRLVASRDARDGSVAIHQDVDVHAGRLGAETELRHPLAGGRHAWLQVARGRVSVNGHELDAGSGAALSDEDGVFVRAGAESEVLLFALT